MSTGKVKLLWGSGSLVITDPTPEIKTTLSYEHRSLEREPGRPWMEAKSVRETLDIWSPIENEANQIITYQGMVDEVITTCKKNNTSYELADIRVPFPKPNIQLAGGFRMGQSLMFFELLKANRSGLFQAPTRWGKTSIFGNIMRVYPGVKTVLAAPGVNLLNQLIDELRVMMPEREIKGIFTGSRNKSPSDDITVVSLDSLEKVDVDGTHLLLVDEPHTAASPKRIPIINDFVNARRIGFGATVAGRFDGADKIITGLFGPVLVRKTFQEAVKEGAVCPIKVFIVKVPFYPFNVSRRDQAYQKLVYQNPHFDSLVKTVADKVIPADWQTLVFIDELKQGDLLNRFLEDAQIAAACRMTEKQRRETFERVRANNIKRVICTDIYATGVTIPEIRCIINAAGGGGSITSTQKPGRLAEIKPGKKAGYLIDFLFTNLEEGSSSANSWKAVVADCYARIKTYKTNGYEVVVVNNPDQIKLE